MSFGQITQVMQDGFENLAVSDSGASQGFGSQGQVS